MTTTRSLSNRLGGIRRFIAALDRDPSEWEPTDLRTLAVIENLIVRARTNIIYGLRDRGYTDRDIAEALGITRQAVSKRWPGGGRFVGAAGIYRQAHDTTTQRVTASALHDHHARDEGRRS